MVPVSEYASEMRGTSANLEYGDSLSVHHLLYGLMLPSGNDAAVALAEYFGEFLYFNKYVKEEYDGIDYLDMYANSYMKYFLREMND